MFKTKSKYNLFLKFREKQYLLFQYVMCHGRYAFQLLQDQGIIKEKFELLIFL